MSTISVTVTDTASWRSDRLPSLVKRKGDRSVASASKALLQDRASLRSEAAADLDALIAKMTAVRTARAWAYKEQWREMLKHGCTCVMRSKVEPMKEVAAMVRRHLEGIVDWAETRQTNGFLEAINGLFQAAKRRARGFGNFETIKTVIFLIAGKLDFAAVNPHAR